MEAMCKANDMHWLFVDSKRIKKKCVFVVHPLAAILALCLGRFTIGVGDCGCCGICPSCVFNSQHKIGDLIDSSCNFIRRPRSGSQSGADQSEQPFSTKGSISVALNLA